MLDNVEHLAVTTDIWTSDSNKAYISVTTRFNEIINAVLATKEIPESHTGEIIASAHSNCFDE